MKPLIFLPYRGRLINVTEIKFAGMRKFTEQGKPDVLQVEFITGGWQSWPDDPEATIEDFTQAVLEGSVGVGAPTPF